MQQNVVTVFALFIKLSLQVESTSSRCNYLIRDLSESTKPRSVGSVAFLVCENCKIPCHNTCIVYLCDNEVEYSCIALHFFNTPTLLSTNINLHSNLTPRPSQYIVGEMTLQKQGKPKYAEMQEICC